MVNLFVSPPKPAETVLLSDLPPKPFVSSDASASQFSETTSLGTFHYSSRLPMELQLQIWNAAARQRPDGGPRIFITMPSTHHFAITIQDLKMLYTVNSKSRPLLTVLQICKNSRKAAKKEFVLWKAGPLTRRRMVYVHRIHDTLYFQ